MNGTNFTRFGRLGKISVFFLILTLGIFSSLSAQGPGGCACKGAVQISLDEFCQATVTADMLLAGTNDCTGGTVLLMTTPTGQPIQGSPVINSTWVGKTLYGKVTNGINSCWSVITVEDKIAPTWEDDDPEDYVMTCPSMDAFAPLAYDNCSIPTVYIISEEITVNTCNLPQIFAGPDTLKLIVRKYLAVDKSGNVSLDTCEVRIWVVGLDTDDFIAVPNVTLQCDGNFARLENGHPSPTDITIGGVTYKGSGVPMLFPWMPSTTGNGTVDISSALGSIRLEGGTNGTNNTAVGAQVCIVAQSSGYISFDWTANKTNDNNNFTSDPIQYTIDGGAPVNILNSNVPGPGVTANGVFNVYMTKDQVLCIRVMTDNAGVSPTTGGHSIFNMTNIQGVGGIALNPDAITACNIYVTYTDTKFPTIKCVTKIMRKWTILEWSCDSNLLEFYQIIEIHDSVGPVISGLVNGSATTGGHACEALYKLPKPTLTDNCSSLLTYDVTYPGGFFKGLKVSDADRFVRLPFGYNEITYTAFDDCHNQTVFTIIVNVEDNTPPVAICDEWTTVGLTTEGKAWVPATSFDDGSYDECDLAKLVVRRMTAPDCIKPCKTPEIPGFKLLDIINGRYYYISNHAVIPSVALKTAKALENYVVTYNNVTESAAVRKLVTDWYGEINFLVGYTDIKLKGTYVWEAPSTYLPGVSGNYQYVVHTVGGSLSSVDNYSEYRYVIEVEDPCGFGAYTEFCCEDIGTDQMVRMRAIDKSGNWNECMVRAVVQDKLPPAITCPPHVFITCNEYFDTGKLTHSFGWPTAYDNCESPLIKQDSIIDLNACRIGTITRTFTVTDRGGRTASCTQTIHVDNITDRFVMTPDRWPIDRTFPNGCADPNSEAFQPAVTGRPDLTADNICTLVGATFEDQVFYFNNDDGDACFKILRHWSVIDWCQPLYNNGGGFTYAQWNHTQVIKVYDNEKPVITSSCAEKTTCTYDPTCTSGFIELIATAVDQECTEVLRYSYKIYPFNGSSFDPGLSKSGLSNTANASGNYPIGKHRIVWAFEDRCGNVSKCEQLFNIVDCKDPTPVCLPLSTALMADPDGDGPALPMVELWAIDFDRKSYKSCNANEVLLFTFDNVPMQVENKTVFSQVINVTTKHYFDKTGGLLKWQSAAYPAGSAERAIVDRYNRGEANSQQGGRIQLWDPATRSAATVWSSNDIPTNVESIDVNIIMTVWDEGFRHDFCMTTLKLICNSCPTPDGNRIAGSVSTDAGEMVDDVIVTVHADMVEYPKSLMTSATGMYEFVLPSGNDFEVGATKDIDHMNGVSTLDLVLIQRHILGLDVFNSPYKVIAADANNDGKVTAADLSELRKLILGTTIELPNNTSWRFPVADQTMNMDNVFPFVEMFTFPQLNTDQTNRNFVAVKVGDVNGNASANINSNKLEARSSQALALTTDNTKFNQGQNVSIPFAVQHSADVAGFQFTLRFDINAFDLESIESNTITLNENNFGFHRLSEGLITVSWNKDNAVSIAKDEVLFTLNLKAKANGEIANAVQLNSEVIKAEAYTQDVNVMGIEFRVGNKSNTQEVVLYQNTPNPFKASTLIGFELPETMSATLKVYDVTGKVVKVINNTFTKGYNSVEIHKNEFGSAGVLYYTLEAGDFKATKKMVVIE
ncbi:MAG: T9SS type A sorting domain-containing protein [Saprospiraceae bacterium]|nr:T9SS type A sorting domain-containing protein [Saprospiraceae bacterium]